MRALGYLSLSRVREISDTRRRARPAAAPAAPGQRGRARPRGAGGDGDGGVGRALGTGARWRVGLGLQRARTTVHTAQAGAWPGGAGHLVASGETRIRETHYKSKEI